MRRIADLRGAGRRPLTPFSPAAAAIVAALSLAAAGCPGSVPATDSAKPGPDSGTDGGGGATDGGGGTTDGGGGTTDSGPGTDAGPGAECGGFTGLACGGGDYCNYPDDLCGAADGSGTCEPRPTGCPEIYDPVCACDGTVYGSSCEAAAAGVDVSTLGGCTPPPGYFACGGALCDLYFEYCFHVVDDTGMPDTWTCTPLPTCSTIGCSCVGTSPPCAGDCTQDANGGATYTCGGG